MTKLAKHRTWFLAALIALSAGSFACGDDESSDEPDGGGEAGSPHKAGAGGKGGKGGAGGKAGSAAAGKAGSAEDEDAGASKDSGPSGGSCEGDDGCYSCEPKEQAHFLNRCTESECSAFDNAERLPLFKDGKLPSLP